MQGVMSQQPWLKDPLIIRKKWDQDEYNLIEHGQGRDLCFAILWDDGHIRPNPPIVRGLEIVKNALLTAGHKGKCQAPSFDLNSDKRHQSLIGRRLNTKKSARLL